MQVIAVERWTFWAAVLTMVIGFVVGSTVGTYVDPTSGTSWDLTPGVFTLALALFLVSLAVGGSRDPSVRRIPPQPSGRDA
jgi:uncharacterized membrane protein YhaH (DUF805 family)